ncbi:MAG: carbon monoxide dehydrogenase [Pseudonocardiaceae bacterium]|nr:carbon monoxide dehydrogenase [Pseudonocardiaceae bacterium]
MEMEHNFTVPASVDTVWEALLDLEQVVPCMPGASLTSRTGDEFAGTVKVRLGPISLQYKGSGRFTERDQAARRAVIEASGKDARGNGTAAATVTTTLAESGSGTAVTVVTDLSVTGKPAQFGRGLISDVGGKIIGQFADCLAGRFESGAEPPSPEPAAPTPEPAPPATGQAEPTAPTSATPAPVRPAPAPVSEEINLLDSAGAPVLKRVVPVVAGLLALFVVLRRLRRRSRSSS